MLKNPFFLKRSKVKSTGAEAPGTPKNGDESESPDDEFQIPSLHRREFIMTAELMRRKEEEALREHYQLSPFKTGNYL